jgi:hypothetical protein
MVVHSTAVGVTYNSRRMEAASQATMGEVRAGIQFRRQGLVWHRVLLRSVRVSCIVMHCRPDRYHVRLAYLQQQQQ